MDGGAGAGQGQPWRAAQGAQRMPRARRRRPPARPHPPSLKPRPPVCRYGLFEARSYRSLLDGTEHLALVHGRVRHAEGVLARVHSESMLGDLLGAERCDSGAQLDAALQAIVARGAGVLVYLRGQQGRGLGLAQELEAYAEAEAACASPAALEDAAFPVSARSACAGGGGVGWRGASRAASLAAPAPALR